MTFHHGPFQDQLATPFDIIIGDPPFYVLKNQVPYAQIRKVNDNQLKTIETPLGNEWLTMMDALMTLPQTKILKLDDPSLYTLFVYYADQWKYTVVWNKGSIGLGREFRKQHEDIGIFSAESFYWYQQANQLKSRWHGSSKALAFPSVLTIPSIKGGVKGQTKQSHINQTPWELWVPFIYHMVKPDWTVFDPFCGSGSIAKAIQYINKKEGWEISYVGCDVDATYLAYAQKSLARMKYDPVSALQKYYIPRSQTTLTKVML